MRSCSPSFRLSLLSSALLLVSAGGGCELLLSSDDGGTTASTGTSAAGGSGPSVGGGSAAIGTSAGGSGVNSGPNQATSVGTGGAGGATDELVLYVDSHQEMDMGPGYTPVEAFKTVHNALVQAAMDKNVTEIHVCAGHYAGFEVGGTAKVKIKGGYQCGKIDRSPDDDWFVDATASTIDSNPTKNALVEISAASDEVMLEGFVIGGRKDSPGGQSIGLLVDGASNAVVSQNKIDGGTGTVATPNSSELGANIGAVGLLDESTGKPVIQKNILSAGTGSGKFGPGPGIEDVGAAGLFVTQGIPTVTDNTIESGIASSSQAQIGLYVEAGGVYLRNRIFVSDKAGAGGVEGLRLGPQSSGGFYGNNLISGGAAGTHAYSAGIEAADDSNNVLAFNTVFSGHAAPAFEYAVQIDASLAGKTSPVFVGNFFVGADSDVAIDYLPVQSRFVGSFQRFQSNVWFGFTKAFRINSSTKQSLDQVQAISTVAFDNHEVFETCTSPSAAPSCVALTTSCSDFPTCEKYFFGTDTDPYLLFSSSAMLPLEMNVTCNIFPKDDEFDVEGTNKYIDQDFESAPRTGAKPPPGAFFSSSPCNN